MGDLVSGGALIGALGLIVLLVAYFVPAFVAYSRGVPNKGSVFVINLFLGWTVVGWVVALAMAARSNQQQPRL
ncbi:superinfection immunity protein [Streptomyces sp. NBC_01022]|uniref:superinfection immunity protein n=1 Tax=Streptomyces sp. NBC_01022 TaxID=2903723 RepID=UPI002DDC53AB|nr:superinfection immunity protein [Streptomyces sp. NBC_01022]WRZ79708.1 superinfection immunity protein [Streptomyces sp. NBC_01022]